MQAAIAAPPPAPPAQAASQPASQAAQPQAAPQAESPAAQQQEASQSPASAADRLPVSAPPSAQASAAADAAAADLKTLQDQIAANPPSGAPPRRLRAIAEAPAAPTSCRQANTSARPSIFLATRARRPSRRINPQRRSAGAPAPRRGIPGINNRLRRLKELGGRRRGAVNDPRDQGLAVGNPRPSFSPLRRLVLSGWDSVSWRAQGRRTEVRSPPQ